jgi:hypothetical protein
MVKKKCRETIPAPLFHYDSRPGYDDLPGRGRNFLAFPAIRCWKSAAA